MRDSVGHSAISTVAELLTLYSYVPDSLFLVLSAVILFMVCTAAVAWVPFVVGKRLRDLTGLLFDYSYHICSLLASFLYVPALGSLQLS